MIYELKFVSTVNGNLIKFKAESVEDVGRNFYNWCVHVDHPDFTTEDKCIEYAKKYSIQLTGNIRTNKVQPGKLRAADIINAAKQAFSIGIGNTAEYSTVVERSRICASCPMMQQGISGCKTCGASGALAAVTSRVAKVFGKRLTTPITIAKSYCKVCNCDLSLLVHLKEIELKNETMEQNQSRPDRCWLKL